MNERASRQVNIAMSAKVYDRLNVMAKERGVSPTSYATMLFDAAYAARVGFSGDADLKTKVELAVVLMGAKKDTMSIAEATGLSEASVTRIAKSWRELMSGRAAA